MDTIQTIQLGHIPISIINLGDSQISMADVMRDHESEWKGKYDDVFSQPVRSPIQSILIQHPDATILIDACAAMPPDTPYSIPGYTPPPDLVAQLSSLNVQPSDVDHIIITHAHFDHLNGLVHYQTESATPNFPNTMHHIGEADLKNEELQQHLIEAFGQPTPFDVVHIHQKLNTLSENIELVEGVDIIHTPGETTGHHMVRVHSEGQTLYAVGDLLHHPIEVEHPEWGAWWADHESCLQSRQALFASALSEDALLVATHISGIGKLQQQGSEVRWMPLDS